MPPMVEGGAMLIDTLGALMGLSDSNKIAAQHGIN